MEHESPEESAKRIVEAVAIVRDKLICAAQELGHPVPEAVDDLIAKMESHD